VFFVYVYIRLYVYDRYITLYTAAVVGLYNHVGICSSVEA